MVKERDNNKQLPGLFKDVIRDLHLNNDTLLMQKRKKYAKENTYPKQIKKIESVLYE